MALTIYLGADHRGFALKEQVRAWLAAQGHKVLDVGATVLDASDDYPDFGYQAARKVAADPESRGILFCGSGIGIAVAANKVKGVRASLVTTPELARMVRNDEDLNVLSLSADYTDFETAKKIIVVFLATPFSNEDRHHRRKDKIARIEDESYSGN
ncbi:MAG: RpiB/LacA/LacB family sugar-phosphate isomerase [bacterium]|nr:RpiB/LacA/LacB family sugar-phosphate isomerase [bacterium]